MSRDHFDRTTPLDPNPFYFPYVDPLLPGRLYFQYVKTSTGRQSSVYPKRRMYVRVHITLLPMNF